MIQKLTLSGLRYVLTHLRECDEREFKATLFTGDIEETVKRIYNLPGATWECRTADGTPAVIGGFTQVWVGLAGGWLWGTADWSKVSREVTRFVFRFILPALDQTGFHRIECRALKGNEETIRWLQLIGFHEEAVTAQFGQGREDFILLARTAVHARSAPQKPSLIPSRHAGRCQADASQLRFSFL